jgi:hypothetical protein
LENNNPEVKGDSMFKTKLCILFKMPRFASHPDEKSGIFSFISWAAPHLDWPTLWFKTLI